MSRARPIVAVTGANGGLGQQIVSSLLTEALQVRALVRKPEGVTTLRRHSGNQHLEVLQMDLAEPINSGHLYGVDVLIHSAAHIPSDPTDAREVDRCMLINATGSLHLMEAAVNAGVSHLVYLSAGNAYRDLGRPSHEGDPLYPSLRAPYYLTSKVAGEVFASHFAEIGACDVTIVRPSAIYGPGMARGGLVQTFVSRAAAGLTVSVSHGGRYSVDLVHVDDVAGAVATCAIERVTGVFNIGSGRSTTTLQLARELQRLLRLEEDRIVIEEESLEPPRLGYSPLDITRAVETFGYSPRSLPDGLATMIPPFQQEGP